MKVNGNPSGNRVISSVLFMAGSGVSDGQHHTPVSHRFCLVLTLLAFSSGQYWKLHVQSWSGRGRFLTLTVLQSSHLLRVAEDWNYRLPSFQTLTQGCSKLQVLLRSSGSSGMVWACWNSCLSLCIRSWLLGASRLLGREKEGGKIDECERSIVNK